MPEALAICLGDVVVGHLDYYEDDLDYVFTFDDSYLSSVERPILGQFFEDRRPGQIVQSGMPPWFANLLPAEPMRQIIARSAGTDALDDFALLRATGADLPGAVTAHEAEPSLRPKPGAASASSRPEAGPPGALRFSLAGLQLKLSVLMTDRGITLPASGQDGKWIAKFASASRQSLPRVEDATLRWAGAAGCQVCPSVSRSIEAFAELPDGFVDLAPEVLLVRRFDRPGEAMDRVHMEDFAQIMDRPPGDPHMYRGSFEELAAILRYLSPTDLREFVRRVVFMVISGNGDAHLKNWALLYPDGRNACLSPCYDLVPTVLYLGGQKLALDLDKQRSFAKVTVGSFRTMAAVAGIDWADMRQWVVESADATVSAWADADIADLFSSVEAARLAAHMSELPILAV